MFNESFGVINTQILSMLGIDAIPWMTEEVWTRFALILIQSWLGFPFIFAMTTGVLQSIPEELYEAANVDGASIFQKFRGITLPMVLYATAPILITQYTFNFNNFNVIFLFNGGGPAIPRAKCWWIGHLNLLDLPIDYDIGSIWESSSNYNAPLTDRSFSSIMAIQTN